MPPAAAMSACTRRPTGTPSHGHRDRDVAVGSATARRTVTGALDRRRALADSPHDVHRHGSTATAWTVSASAHGYTAEQHHPLVCPPGRSHRALHRNRTAGSVDHARRRRGRVVADRPGNLRAGHLDVRSDLERLETFIADQAADAGVPLERCVVGGIARVATWRSACGQARRSRYAGVWAICCGLPSAEGLDIDPVPAMVDRLCFSGAPGTRSSARQPKDVIATLAGGGWDLRDHAYDMAHSQTIEMMVDARDWLAGVRSGRLAALWAGASPASAPEPPNHCMVRSPQQRRRTSLSTRRPTMRPWRRGHPDGWRRSSQLGSVRRGPGHISGYRPAAIATQVVAARSHEWLPAGPGNRR